MAVRTRLAACLQNCRLGLQEYIDRDYMEQQRKQQRRRRQQQHQRRRLQLEWHQQRQQQEKRDREGKAGLMAGSARYAGPALCTPEGLFQL